MLTDPNWFLTNRDWFYLILKCYIYDWNHWILTGPNLYDLNWFS